MPDTKYNLLPDYDSNSQVIYETPDPVPNDDLALEAVESRRSSIDIDEISIVKARDIFTAKCSSDKDIPDSWKLRTPSVGGETLADRIERLKREVKEAQNEAKVSKNLNLKDEADHLAVILSDLVIENDKNSKDIKNFALEALNMKTIEGPIESAPTKITKNLPRISLLEERLAYLESILKPILANETDFVVDNRPILSTLNDMEKKLNLLTSTPQAIDSISKMIDSQQMLARSTNSRFGAGHISQTQRGPYPPSGLKSEESEFSVLLESSNIRLINEIYEKLSAIGNIDLLIPRVLGRLKSLQVIHADAGASISLTQELHQKLSSMDIEINEWKNSLKILQENFIKTIDITEKNRVDIEDWVKTLEQKVAEL
ncbi:hypothetical protein NADFUDRAFT_50605 [Nadsonia fulvescens var. elongata DSM 6958]|uniref:Dynactin subunit n=1 Tax=Nadsonia fulvescens var. elongata DSM 6958 TaxID=857566 RepID=A0A1E3PN87_9ASCO|nr:hypothetical protein NADFUDRAFT_50605 [Nadsonia fulvescens var. elongata DSM 6958]